MPTKCLVIFFLVGLSLCQIVQNENIENESFNISTVRTTAKFSYNTDRKTIESTTILSEVEYEKDFPMKSNVNETTDQFTKIEASSTTTTISTEEKDPQEKDENREFFEKVLGSPARKDHQEGHSKPDDVKEDFLHFVQTALRSASKKQENFSNNSSNAPDLIQKLFNTIPRHRNKPKLGRNPADQLLKEEALITSESDDNNDDYSHENNQNTSSVLNEYADHEEAAHHTSPHQSTSRRISPFQPRRFGLTQQNHMAASERQLDRTEYNVNSKLTPDNSGVRFSSTPNWADPNISRKTQNHRREPEANYRFKTLFEEEFEAFSSKPPLQRPFQPFASQRKKPEDEYDLEESRRQAESASSSKPLLQRPAQPFASQRRKAEDEYDLEESRRQAESAKYSFASDIEDNINGNQHHRQETREGTKVTGSYTYEDGFYRRTVHYVADENGYRVVKEEVDEIGNGPSYNPDGSAKFHANIDGTNVNYQITNKDIYKMPHTRYQTPDQQFGHGWSY